MKKTCILVLGMHRSGTSALTGVLQLLDVYLGENLMNANDDNIKGFFENNDLYRVNEKLLSQIGSSWDDVFYDEKKLESKIEMNELEEVLKKISTEKDIFAIKDPRIAFLFPFYKKVLINLDIDIKIILPYRNPLEIANSLKSRNKISIEKGVLLWLYHFLLNEKYSREFQRIFISFDDLIINTNELIVQISNKLDLNLVDKYKDKQKEITSFLDRDLKHHNSRIGNESKSFPFIVKKLTSLKDNFNNKNILKDFDSISEELNSYKKLFYNDDLISYIDEINHTIILKDKELENKDKELENKDKELENKDKELENKDKELEDTKEILMKIYSSKRWKLIKKYDSLIELLKMSKRIILSPIKALKLISIHNIKMLIKHLKNGNFSYIHEKYNYFTNTKVIEKNLDLITEDDLSETIIFDKEENPEVSIVIPVYNQWEYTYKCLKSIYKHTKGIKYEIIIADDVSNDETIIINEFIKNITVIRNEKNLGFLLNCNNAAKYAKGKYIHLLNNDTQVQAEWLSSLLKLIKKDKSIGMVGSQLIYPDGRLQEAGGIIWNDASGWNLGKFDDPTKPEFNYVKEVDYISGASIMIKHELWKDIGGFDKLYIPAYYEDSDFAFEVRKRGYKVMYQPKSKVVHFEGISNGTDLGSGIKSYQVENKEKFIKKWAEELNVNHFNNAENVHYARDRSQNKKHILIIDHYTPHFDKDAGSRTMWQYLELFVSLDYKVVFLGANFYKHEPYTSLLQEMGVEVLYGVDIYNNYDRWFKDNGKYFDFTYLLRPHIANKYIDLVKTHAHNSKIVYNGTDFHFLRLEREYELTKDKSILVESQRMKDIEYKIFNAVDLVITISEYEKDVFQKTFKNKAVELIPTFIYKESFPLSKNNEFNNREGLLFVGGFLHTPNYIGIKWFLDEMWDMVKNLIPEIKLFIVGSKTPEDIKLIGMADKQVHVLGFVSDEKLNDLYNSVRVCIAPLTYGAGVKGKIIESVANGIPIVTTSIGAEGITDSETIISIKNEEKLFIESIKEIYLDETIWNKYRRIQIEYSKKYFSFDHAKNIIKKLF